MACELQIHRNPNNYVHPDVETNKTGVYKKGYIVTGKNLPHSGWGAKERFDYGTFVYLTVSDASWEELEDYNRSWELKIDYEKLGQNLSVDGHRYRIFGTNPGVSLRGAVSPQRVAAYLDLWNVSVVSWNSNEVVVDVAIYDMLRSKGFWDRPEGLQGLTASENYNQSTGDHIVTVDWSNYMPTESRNIIASNLRSRILQRGGVIDSVDSQNQVGTFTINRTDVLKWFRTDLFDKVRKQGLLYRREFYIPESDVDNLVQYSTNHNGDSYTVTKAQLASTVQSMLTKADA